MNAHLSFTQFHQLLMFCRVYATLRKFDINTFYIQLYISYSNFSNCPSEFLFSQFLPRLKNSPTLWSNLFSCLQSIRQLLKKFPTFSPPAPIILTFLKHLGDFLTFWIYLFPLGQVQDVCFQQERLGSNIMSLVMQHVKRHVESVMPKLSLWLNQCSSDFLLEKIPPLHQLR